MVSSIQAQAPGVANPSAAAQVKDKSGLDRDAFMKLLVAQLAHQDPMAPSDPSEFVAQLSQFTSLEQLVGVKEGMDLLAVTETAGTSAQMVSFIGKSVSVEGSAIQWKKDGAPIDIRYGVPSDAAEVSVRVVDNEGRAVLEKDLGPMLRGERSFVFDGKGTDGKALPPGSYHVEFSAKNADGKVLDVSERTSGVVTGVTFVGGYPQLVLADGRTVGLAQVIEVLAGASTDTAGSSDAPAHDTDTTYSANPTEPTP